MTLSERLTEALNEQIGHEMGASMQYIAIATYFDGQTLPELARFFYRQADEERDHAMRFVQFLLDVDAPVRIPEIPAPKNEFDSAEEAVGLSLEWEKTVTQQIYDLVELAEGDANLIAVRFLDWFVNEQLEEVSTMSDLLSLVRRAGEAGLLHVEEYLAREGMPTDAAD
ncbi:MAG: ferritin [Thermoanaerobaculia bacterium]|nr:ferritin [Thermoanaerobaculia bacterium]